MYVYKGGGTTHNDLHHICEMFCCLSSVEIQEIFIVTLQVQRDFVSSKPVET